MAKPLLVLSDVHLSRNYGTPSGRDLARLIEAHPDCEIVLAGDIFDLTLDAATVPTEDSIHAALDPHAALVTVLRAHVRKGGPLSLIPGNHDGTLAGPNVADVLRGLLGAESKSTVNVYPWFLRRGGLHIEHGHLYDPDCAPNHPLADPNPTHEGLGNALMRRFVAPNEAFLFAHKNQTTMSSGIAAAFKKWGPRAPWVIAQYMTTALSLWAEATTKQGTVASEKEQGRRRLMDYASEQQLPSTALESLLELSPRPTHHSSKDVFYRLYFDRVFAATSLALGAGLLSSAGLAGALGVVPLLSASGALTASGTLLSALGAGYLINNVSKSHNRYGDAVIGQLASGAEKVRAATGAELVVLGHSHVEVDEPGYVNLGSFGYGRTGRPYLMVDPRGHHEKKWL